MFSFFVSAVSGLENGVKICCLANHRVGETGLTDSGTSNRHHHNIPYAVLHGMNVPTSFMYVNFFSFKSDPSLFLVFFIKLPFLSHQEGSSDLGDLEEAIVVQGVKIRNDEAKPPLFTPGRPAATLEMFPSRPMRFQQIPRGSSKSGGESADSGSAVNTISSKTENQLEPESPINSTRKTTPLVQQQQKQQDMASEISRPQEKKRGSTSEKQLDAKTLRRLAQNREAARKSRLRKKAYVQQLESSRIKLTQLEQDLQRARSQGFFLGGCAGAVGNISSGVAIFDVEYSRWLEDDQRHMLELRTGLNAHLSDSDLRIIVDSYISHYDEIFRLKVAAAKADVFHLITGMWTTPAERCFLWMGGFRPSELIKMLISQLDPLTEQQVMGIYSLQHSSQQAEEALTQGLEQLQQSLTDTIAGRPVVDGMQQMAVALGKLANLEVFVRQSHVPGGRSPCTPSDLPGRHARPNTLGIRGHPTEAIRKHPRPSESIRGHPTEVIRTSYARATEFPRSVALEFPRIARSVALGCPRIARSDGLGRMISDALGWPRMLSDGLGCPACWDVYGNLWGLHGLHGDLPRLLGVHGDLADNLRQQTLHQLSQILTVRQAARCFLMIGEYYGRLRALSSLWASRPRE
ncbi:Transcription factor HBP-1b(c1) [Hibiscus syriacus]|uniref:Transcription factor HBP-1b(C1) n=1 Tax=Hibiscus syriacus TaxID=106335 RepID=A0A6A3ASE6_HIBSY|nr:Transcription factor HBP-1b(c1) [Hibiscus syriacus]